MKLYLRSSAVQAKMVGYRTPGKFYKVNKGYLLYADKPTEVPDEEAELILAQNPHLATTEIDEIDKIDEVDEGENENGENGGVIVDAELTLATLRELSSFDDLMAVNMKVLRGYAKNIGVDAPVTMTKETLVANLNERCAELVEEL